MPDMEVIPPQIDGGFEVVDLSAFGVAAMPEPEPVEEEPIEKAEVEPLPKPEPEPEPEILPEPEPEPEVVEKVEPAPLPKPKPKPVVQPKPKPEPKPVQKAEAKPQPKPQPKPRPKTTASAGSQSAFVPPTSNAAYLRNPKPTYPSIAQRRGMEGVVLVMVEVTAQGVPKTVTVKKSSGFMLLDKAALKAVRAWRFAPATRGRKPVAAGVEVPIRFKLNDA